ncbi:MAG: hypothetical protein ACOCW2_05085 [Chitinivibrionales bacterium]
MKILLLVVTLLFAGCASRYEIERKHTSHLRRMPQMHKVETGSPMKEGSFRASASFSYTADKPGVMHLQDSSFETRSSIDGDEYTIITSSDVFCYESRLSVSGEGMYAFTDIISGGVAIDASLGEVHNLSGSAGKSVEHDIIEGAFFMRFAKRYDKVAVCIKPEFSLTHIRGSRSVRENNDYSDSRSATERVSTHAVSVRSSSVIRFDMIPYVSPFAGFQIKSHHYTNARMKLDYETAYGVYSGLDIHTSMLSVSPFITIPLGAATTGFTSPVAGGVQLSMTLHDD